MSNYSAAKDVMAILSDEASLKIMKVLDKKEMTIQGISSVLNLPLSSTYRKVNKLEQNKIIKKTKVIRRLDGLDESFYMLWVNEINIHYKENTFSVNLKQKPLEERIIRLWQKFKE